MKHILIAALLINLTGCMIDEPDLTSEFEATPYEKCRNHYKGTEKVEECPALRLRISDAEFNKGEE